jgi:signal transduction histidine kinase
MTKFVIALLVYGLLTSHAYSAPTRLSDAMYGMEVTTATVKRPPAYFASAQTLHMVSTSLPHVVRRSSARTTATSAEWETHWFVFNVQRTDIADWGLYIPRVRWPRLAGRFDIFVDGTRLSDADIVWNSPVLVKLPATADQTFEVAIALSLDPAHSGALSAVRIGDFDSLRWRYAWRQILQQRLPQVTGISFVILGAFTFAFWLRRRHEVPYLLFSLMAAVNFIRTLHYYFIDPQALGDIFWWVTINSLAWLMVLAHLFAFRLHGEQFPRTERALIVAVAVVSIASLAAVLTGISIEIWGPLTYLVQIPVGIVVPLLTTLGAWRTRSKMAMLLAAALWMNVVMGVHDFLLQNWRINPESSILLPYGAMAILAVFLLHISRRYLGAIQDAEQLTTSLEHRLMERSRELELSHEKLRTIEHEQAVTTERQRLMREMHDGLGSSLMSSLVMVEQGRLDNAQVATVLRESIDDLKLTIDSLEPMGDDLLTLLGTLRYRLGKRLETAGIKLEWQVQETPPLRWLNPTASLQILRILQEALTNTLKHAQATVIRVETGVSDNDVFIRLIDNGRGFNVDAAQSEAHGRGLQNLHRRASLIGGSVQLQSQAGQTVVTLQIPIEHRSPPR